MFETGKAKQIALEMKNYALTILGLCETRWTGAGQTRLATGETVLYSGHEDVNAQHSEGVAIMLAKQAQKALIAWEALGPRLIHATFRTSNSKINLNVIQVYAPTNDKDETIKEEFYSLLRKVLEKRKSKDITVLMGDFNAKIGDNNMGYEETMGKHGLGTMNENGEMLANLCATNQLIIGGSLFPHKRIHKATWVSPDHKTENQIDHVCISNKFRSSLHDVKVFRGADVASDHHLLIAKLRLKLKRFSTTQNHRVKYNVNFLQEQEKKKEFCITLSNKYSALSQLEDESVENHWQLVKEALTSTCDAVLGKKAQQHKEWISQGTIKKIQERRDRKADLCKSKTRAAKGIAQEKYTKSNKEVKKLIKADKRNYIENLAKEAEESAAKGNMRDLFSKTKQLAGKYQNNNKPVKDKNGKILSSIQDQVNRWTEHFKELLNRPAPSDPPDIQEAEEDLPINCEKPNKEEIKAAILLLRNGKASGPDGIPAEALKASIGTSTEIIYKLLAKIWDNEDIPKDWREGHLVKLPKKGDLHECSNYRGIMLLSVPGKVLSRVILERLKKVTETKIRDEQAGFRQNRSCTDQTATLRIVVEQSIEWNSPLYINFVDYEKAFDSLDRETLWKLLRHYGIPEKITNLIKKMYENMASRVIHEGQLTEPFEVKTGVRQGCLLSPFLFLLAIDWIMRTTTAGRRNGIQWSLTQQLEDLDFADDLALLSHSHAQMQDKTTTLNRISKQTGLNIHREKTKIMRINTGNNEPLTLENEPLQDVNTFTYLGSIINRKGGTEEDIKARIQKARGAFVTLKNIWKTSQIKTKTKIRIFNSNVKSVLLYGSETWRTTKATSKKVQVFINRCLRTILRLHWSDKTTNEELWRRTGQRPIEQELKQRRWRWIGHTLRRPRESISRQALSWNPQGKRGKGRPRNTWRREVETEVGKTRKTWRDLEKCALDRRAWRDMVVDLCLPGG